MDGKTVFLGVPDETLIATSYRLTDTTYYAFWNKKDQCYKFYNNHKTLIDTYDVENESLGKYACLCGDTDVVFIYSSKKFCKSPHCKSENYHEV